MKCATQKSSRYRVCCARSATRRSKMKDPATRPFASTYKPSIRGFPRTKLGSKARLKPADTKIAG